MVVVAESLQVRRVVIGFVSINVVNTQLAGVDYLEGTAFFPLTVVFFVHSPRPLYLGLDYVVLGVAPPVVSSRGGDIAQLHRHVLATLTAVSEL